METVQLLLLFLHRDNLETFLSGMETIIPRFQNLDKLLLETFLSGMETADRRRDGIPALSLETFLSGMETGLQDQLAEVIDMP